MAKAGNLLFVIRGEWSAFAQTSRIHNGKSDPNVKVQILGQQTGLLHVTSVTRNASPLVVAARGGCALQGQGHHGTSQNILLSLSLV